MQTSSDGTTKFLLRLSDGERVETVLIPAENVMNLDEAVPEVKANIEFIPCRSASDVLREALVKRLPQIQAEPVKPAETPQVAIPPEIPPVTQIWR